MRKLHTADVIAIDTIASGAIASDSWAETQRRPKSIYFNWRVH